MIADDSWGPMEPIIKNLAKSPNFCIQLYGKTLERVAKFSYLGVVLDDNLSWKDHFEYVSSKVSRRHA